MPLSTKDIKSAILNLMPVLTELILANLNGIEETSDNIQPNEEEERDDQRENRRPDHHTREDRWDTMTRDGHGRVRPTKENATHAYQWAPIDKTTKNRDNGYRDNWPTLAESRRDTVYVNRRRQNTERQRTQPNNNQNKREDRSNRATEQEYRNRPNQPIPRTGPVASDVFNRIRPAIYTVMRIVQSMHHADQWILTNPIRSMVAGVHRMMDNIRPPVPDESIKNSFRKMGDEFLSAISLRMNLHLDDVRRKAIHELSTMEAITRDDKDIVHDQALHLLRRNFGRKLTDKDINMYLPEAVSYINLSAETREPNAPPGHDEEEAEIQGQQRRRRRSSNKSINRSQRSPPPKKQGTDLNDDDSTAESINDPMDTVFLQPETPKSSRTTREHQSPPPERRTTSSATTADTPRRHPERVVPLPISPYARLAESINNRWNAPNPRREHRIVILGDSNVRHFPAGDDRVIYSYPGAYISDATDLMDRTMIKPTVEAYVVAFGYNHLMSDEDMVDLTSEYSQAINSLKTRGKRPVFVLGLTILNHLETTMKERALQFNKILRAFYAQDFIEPVPSDLAVPRVQQPSSTDVHFDAETARLSSEKVRVRLAKN